MKLSPHFLRSLQQRLKVGNRSGVHLNALPGRSRYKFDVHSLGKIWEGFVQHFLDTLLRDPKFRFAIDFDGIDLQEMEEEELRGIHEVAKRLNNLAYQVKDIELEKGIHTFGFGYPLLVRRDHKDHKITVAPLFIWSLQIIQHPERHKWTIVKSEDDPIILNEVLLNHLESDIGIQLGHLNKEILEDGVLDRAELKALCIQVLEKTNYQVPAEEQIQIQELPLQLSPIPTKKEFEEKTKHRAYIHWGGIFSIFETQKESIIKAYDELLLREEAEIQLGSLDNFKFQSLSSVQTDPSQQGILNALKNRRNLVVHGPPGTGKSQTLTAIITNALENQKSVLVVCEKRTALEVIHQNLQSKGLADFSIILRDEKKDRRKVVDRVRNIVDEHAPSRTKVNASKAPLQAKIDQCMQLISQINYRHTFINKHFLEEQNWSAIVGQVLDKKIKAEGTHFPLQLDFKDWSFTVLEYEQTEKFLAIAEQQYLAARPLLPSIFKIDRWEGDNPYLLEDKIRASVKKYRQAFIAIKELETAYHLSSGEQFQQILIEDKGRIQDLLDQLEYIFQKHTGDPNFGKLEKTSGFFYQTLAVFSKRKQQLIADQQECLGLMQQLQKKLYSIPSFAYKGQPTPTITAIAEEIYRIKNRKTTWMTSWPRLVELHKEQLRESVLEQGDPNLPAFQKYRQAIAQLVDQINKDAWLAKKFTLMPGIKKDINNIDQQIKAMEDFFAAPTPNFKYLFEWTLALRDLKAPARALITQLKDQKEWGKIFSFQYLETLLKNNASTLSISNEHQYAALDQALQEIEDNQIQYIQKSIFAQQLKSILHFNRSNELKVRNLYNKRKSEKHQRQSLRRIVHADFSLFSSFFPVVLASPTLAATLFYGMEEIEPFDIVLFDEASQLRVEETLPALLKGRQKIIAGDEHQMPPSSYFSKIFEGLVEDEDLEEEENQKVELENQLLSLESLLEFSIDLDFDNYHLDFHYRSKHPQLIDFSNAAFYQQRLQAMPGVFDYCPIRFVAVDGVYQAGCNPQEAQEVIDILDQKIIPDEKGQWPSVGIATFNLRQRNFILTLMRESVLANPAFAKKMKHLEAQGLFVKNLENIQGDERDIIILSTTYGKGTDGKFRQNFGPINYQKGYKLLNVIITRAKYKIFVCTSIDAAYYTNYQQFLDTQGNNRRGVFYAYLTYAKAVSDGSEAQRQSVLAALRKNTDEVAPLSPTLPKVGASLFEKQVYQLLLQHFDASEITLQYTLAGFQIDLLYQAKNQSTPPIVIECDGSWYFSNEEAYLNDLHRQRIFEKQGFVFYRIWSTNWWRDHEREMKKLLDFIANCKTKNALPAKETSLKWLKEDGGL